MPVPELQPRRIGPELAQADIRWLAMTDEFAVLCGGDEDKGLAAASDFRPERTACSV